MCVCVSESDRECVCPSRTSHKQLLDSLPAFIDNWLREEITSCRTPHCQRLLEAPLTAETLPLCLPSCVFFPPDCFRRGLKRYPCSRQQSGNSSLSVVVRLIKEWIRGFKEFGGPLRTADFKASYITFIYHQLS